MPLFAEQTKPARCWSQCQHSFLMPRICVSVFAADERLRRRSMALQKKLYDVLCKANQYIKDNKDEVASTLSAMMKDVQFHRWQIVLEAWGTAERAGWDAFDCEVRELAFSIYGAPSNTKWSCEDPFASLTHVAAASNKGYLKMNRSLSRD